MWCFSELNNLLYIDTSFCLLYCYFCDHFQLRYCKLQNSEKWWIFSNWSLLKLLISSVIENITKTIKKRMIQKVLKKKIKKKNLNKKINKDFTPNWLFRVNKDFYRKVYCVGVKVLVSRLVMGHIKISWNLLVCMRILVKL